MVGGCVQSIYEYVWGKSAAKHIAEEGVWLTLRL